MLWALRFLFKLFVRDDAGYYDIKRGVEKAALEKDNRVQVTVINKIYEPPYEFEILVSCENNKNVIYKLAFSALTPYEECVHKCECGVPFNFTAMKARYEREWSDYGFSERKSDCFIGEIVNHKFKITKPCVKALDIKIDENVESD